MNISKLLIIIGGFYCIAFLVFHLMFWKLFKWKEQLAKLWKANSAIMQVLNLCLIFVFAIMAYVSIFNTYELMNTRLGEVLLVSFSLFWFFRTIEQIVFFKLKTKITVIFMVVFLIGTAIYLYPAIMCFSLGT